MHGWYPILRMIHDNITTIFFVLVVAVFVVGWLIIEAARSHTGRNEIFRLRQRVAELERERYSGRIAAEPVVLPGRWIRIGSAATTNDGGCLVLVEKVAAAQHRAVITVRIDGLATLKNQQMQAGERLELSGKSGTYVIELYGIDGIQAHLAVMLRSRHAAPSG